MKYDLLFKEANVYLGKGNLEKSVDVAVKDGKIVAKGPDLPTAEAKKIIHAKDKLLSPSFTDTHMHIDLSYTYDYELEVPSLIGGAKLFKPEFDRYHYLTEEQIFEECYNRSKKTLDNCIKNGTTLVKTNVTYMDTWKGIALDATLKLKQDYKNYCDLLSCVTFTNPIPDEEFEKQVVPEWEKAAEEGKIDFVSGYPHKHPDCRPVVDSIFERAKKFGLPIDIHCDESDVPNLDCLSYVLDKTMEEGFEGKVTLGHVTALSSKLIDEQYAKEMIKKIAKADASITSLTSCNMYLMNSNRRGPTRVRELLDAGVNVAIASDDIREVLRPFGNCDLLEEALLTAQVHKMGTAKQLRQVFDMITFAGARNAGLDNYGIEAGNRADLVLLDANTPEEAILSQVSKLYVLKNGQIVVENGILNDKILQ